MGKSARRGTSSKPSATCPLAALAKPASVTNLREQSALAAFARSAGIEHAEIARVMAKASGDKLETAKLYAVLADAVNGKVSSGRAASMRTVLDALREGRVHVVKAELTRSRAAYDHTSNTLRVPLEGISLSSEADRATLVHEAEHVAQDIRMARQTRYESESEGHEAAADYLLHLWGALTEDTAGTHIDVTRAAEAIGSFQERSYENVDAVAASHLCLRIAQEAARRGEHVDLDEARKVFGGESFAKAYDGAQNGVGNSATSFGTVMTKGGL